MGNVWLPLRGSLAHDAVRAAADDLDARRPGWAAFSRVFLDRSLEFQGLVDLLDAGYSIDQLESILRVELAPVLAPNLQSVAGVWIGFDLLWLEDRVLHRERSRFWRWHRWRAERWPPCGAEWMLVREALERVRAMMPRRHA